MIRFVTGTDTGVGKTVACAALARAALAAGRSVRYFKPVQTGLRPGVPGDAAFVASVTGIDAVEGVRFPEPLAPAAAALVAGEKVDVDALVERASELARGCDELLVEGAGGLLVPLGEGVDMAGFARRIAAAEVVVVARPGLGTLNHTALTVEAARARSLVPVIVVSNWPAEPGLTETTNLERLRDLAPVAGLVPAVGGLDVEAGRAPAAPLLDAGGE